MRSHRRRLCINERWHDRDCGSLARKFFRQDLIPRDNMISACSEPPHFATRGFQECERMTAGAAIIEPDGVVYVVDKSTAVDRVLFDREGR
jgi:hypothetical protein